jgi:hypothetical protein
VRGHLEPLVRDSAGTSMVRTIPREHYRWFVLSALVCLMAAVFVTGARGARGSQARSKAL